MTLSNITSNYLVLLFAISAIAIWMSGIKLTKAIDAISTHFGLGQVFWGNAFLPVLFLMASIIGGDAILPNLKPSEIYLTMLGIILTGIYMAGMVIHSKKQIARMGVDSFIVLIVYIIGIFGLFLLI